MRSRIAVAVAVVCTAVYVTGVRASAQQAPAEGPCARITPLPVNILVTDVLTPLLADLFDQSPTFREQCRRIGQARYLRVFVAPVFGQPAMTVRARATIRGYSQGAVIALVFLPVPLRYDDVAELIAHEFEHVVEQIDRVDLAALAEANAGASRLTDGAFETDRARRAGRVVAAEALAAIAAARDGTGRGTAVIQALEPRGGSSR